MAESFATILEALEHAIEARLSQRPFMIAVFTLLRGRLRRLSLRFAALAARFEAATLRPPRATPPRPRPAPPPGPPDAARLPQGFAWVVTMVPGSAALGDTLREFLAQPRTAALLKAAPQTGRMLRPLCHMLGITVFLDPSPRSPRLLPARPEPAGAAFSAPAAVVVPPKRDPPITATPTADAQWPPKTPPKRSIRFFWNVV